VVAVLRARWEQLLEYAERRLPALTRYRRSEPLPISLHTRRIYVLPTPFGVFFGFVLTVMLLGGLNFSNNAALLLTFTLGGAIVITLPRTVAHLDQLDLVALRAEPVPAGDPLQVAFLLVPRDGRARPALELSAGGASTPFDCGADGSMPVVAVATNRRGWHAPGRAMLSTSWPFGLFRAWSVLHPDVRLLVWPRAEGSGPALPRGALAEAGRTPRPHGEDWQGLREYRAGDARRLIAWRASARADRLLVKEFADPQANDVALDWFALEGLAGEARIARLTRWAREASAAGLAYRLVLPESQRGPGRGLDHLADCLRDLALLP
jgi:uncharacterized protein (DUF58 family)